ncbi:MAG: hypothetical protein LBG87_05680 [Spirochaetaceae bacterium]|jgi:hypothetical protein|nr:hypothetical protein [Spirochaetaceae bacterium]
MKERCKILAAVFFLFSGVFFAGCPIEEPDEGVRRKGWLDPRLIGTWRFTFEGSYEQCVITGTPRNTGPREGHLPLGSLVFGYKGWGGAFNPDAGENYHDQFGGDIVYAEAFRTSSDDNTSAGILIIEYYPGLENKWPWWSEAPENWAAQDYKNTGKNFYGIYYINLWAEGRQVFLAQSNDQKTNYGPTETRTLKEAIAKFTEENLPNMLNLDVGDPHTRYEGPLP